MGDEGMRSVYIISPKTKAIMTKESAYYRAHILEENKENYSVHTPEQIIDYNCLLYGSTLKGRRGAVKDVLKSASKLPVPIIPDKGVFMIPTASTKNKDCVWVAYHHIDDYEQRNDRTFIAFHDGTGIYINTSVNTFDSQYKRTSQVIVHVNRGIIFGKSPYAWW